MSQKPKTNKATLQLRAQTVINGLTKHASTLPSVTVGGTTIKTPDVIASLQADIAAMNAVTPAKAAWQTAVQASRVQHAKTATLLSQVLQAIRVLYAGQVDVLADFGEKPRKTPAPRTTEQKAASAAKAKATRAARHTMGSVEKQAVMGNVTGVVVTPVVSAPVAAPVANATGSPAPAAAGPTATPKPAVT